MSMRNMDPLPDMPSYHLFTQPTDKAVLAERSRGWKGDEFSFHDVLDTINPLQHLPVISSIYRYLTGDKIGAIPRIAGDTLYGGPIGFLTGLVGASLKKDSGKDPGEMVVALVTGDDSGDSGKTAVAAASPAATDGGAATGSAAGQAAAPSQTTAAGRAAAQAATSPVVIANQAALAQPATVAAVSAASAASTPVSAAVAGGPSSVASVAQTTGRGTAAAAAMPDNDPRAAFLARADAMRRQYSGAGGVTPTSKVVPLQGVGLPPSYYNRPQQIKLTAPGMAGSPSSGGSATPPATTQAAPATAASPAADAAGPPASGQPSGTAPNGLPSNPPVNVSQQMMDALDKYMRLQQQQNSGNQVDVAH